MLNGEREMPNAKYDELMSAIYSQDEEKVRKCLEDPTIDLNQVHGENNNTPLMVAISPRDGKATQIREKIALMIINDPRTRMDVYSKNGRSVLHNAIQINCSENLLSAILTKAKAETDLDMVRFLNSTYETTKEDERIHETALYLASSKGNTKAVQLLLAAGAEINNTNSDGKTALIGAIEARSVAKNRAEHRLIQEESDLNDPNSDLSELEKKEEMIAFSKELAKKLNTTLEPLLDTIRILLANDAKNEDVSALEKAASTLDVEVAHLLLNKGVNPLSAINLLETRLKLIGEDSCKELTQEIPIIEEQKSLMMSKLELLPKDHDKSTDSMLFQQIKEFAQSNRSSGSEGVGIQQQLKPK